MSTDLLFEHFASLATAPDGIARLRELILQLAVQGKLGTQDVGDEPASVLLERITKTKERSVNGGKIKREKPIEPKCELAYRLPKAWICTPLGAITSFEYGKSLPKIKREDSGKVPVFGSNGIVGYHSEAITKGPSLIIGRKGSVGAIQITNVPCHPIDTAYFIDNFENLDQFFLFYLLTSLKLASLDKSTAIPGLNRNDAYNLLIGLPPLAEQHRIVAKVDRLMALCDELEARQQKERAGCLKLGTASLAGLQNADSPEEFGRQWAQVCDAFDLILDCPENVAVLRQTILQLAVQGRLVQQEPGDEPSTKLVEKIRKEKERLVNDGKIKREKSLDPLDRTTISYKIPESWSHEYLNDICELVVDPDHNMPKAVETGVKFISSKDLNDEGIINFSRNIKLISEEDYSRLAKKFQPKRGDILFARIGARIGKPCIVDSDERFMISYSCCVIRPLFVDIKYVNYFLKEASFLAIAYQKTVGVGVPDLGMKMIKQFVVPLPPLAEQHRIVAKVDALMALCDALESQLKERAGVQGRLAGAVGKMVAG